MLESIKETLIEHLTTLGQCIACYLVLLIALLVTVGFIALFAFVARSIASPLSGMAHWIVTGILFCAELACAIIAATRYAMNSR